MKKILLIPLFILAFSLFPIQFAQAPYTQNRTFNALPADGYISTLAMTYGAARNSTIGNITDTDSNIIGGQRFVFSSYSVYRSFLYFDTSSMPSNAIVTLAKLSLKIQSDSSTTDFNVTIQNGQPTYPHSPLQSGDFNLAYYSGLGGSRNTSDGLSVGNYWNITLNSDGRTWVKGGTTTKLTLRSSNDINNIAPTGFEYILYYSYEYGVSSSAKLYVTYTYSPYVYIVHGVYYENGYLANTKVQVTLSYLNNPPYVFTLNSTGGTEDTETIYADNAPIAFTWNITTPITNKTRTFYLTSATFEELYIFLPNPNEPYYLYTFTLTDFAGITQATLESRINVNGTMQTVERQKADVVNSLPFWMTWAHRYDMKLQTAEGSYTWGGFIALTEFTQGLVITNDMFPTTEASLNLTVNALRMNGTYIQVNWTDNELITDWVQINIKTKSGNNWVTVYTTNNTGNTQQINWYSAAATTSYIVNVHASRSNQVNDWNFALPPPAASANIWEGLFDFLGTFPFPAANLLSFFIVLFFFAGFSYASLNAGIVSSVLIAGFLKFIGWFTVEWSAVSLALVIVIFIILAEGKRREGYNT